MDPKHGIRHVPRTASVGLRGCECHEGAGDEKSHYTCTMLSYMCDGVHVRLIIPMDEKVQIGNLFVVMHACFECGADIAQFRLRFYIRRGV